MKAPEFKVAVVGGGAAGMMAAVSASRLLPGPEILLLEKNHIIGRKLSVTGNGRCNLSNRFCRWQDYGGQERSIVRGAFECLSPKETEILFEELGVPFREEDDGRLYPYSEQAYSVTGALSGELEAAGVHIRPGAEVSRIEKAGGKFIIEADGGLFQAHSLVIATGGKAGHRYGSTGDGYGFAKSFGHQLQRPLPALVQIVTADSFAGRLKGVRVKGAVSLVKDRQVVAREEGEIQFTGDGISGICAFDLSRHLGEEPGSFDICIDLFPGYARERLREMLEARKKRMVDRPAESLLAGMLNDKLIPVYLELSGVSAGLAVKQADEEQLGRLTDLLKSRQIAVKGTRGWVEAQVTVGGVRGTELQSETLESKLVPGLFFAGEVLDIDGRCGGWNLQWAWSSGWTAGKYAASR